MTTPPYFFGWLSLTKNKVKGAPQNVERSRDLNGQISVISAFLICLYLCAVVFFTPSVAAEEQINVKVLSHEGLPLPSIVVELEPKFSEQTTTTNEPVAIMDQIDQQFVPHILVVEIGRAISFPNSDDIKHHVYSFSPAKTFEQQLYKGREAAPIVFEEPGIVELGCNIHDWMQGFIYVAKGKHYGLTNNEGVASIPMKNGLAKIHVWHPLMQEKTMRLTVEATSAILNNDVYTITLTEPMIESLSAYERLNIDVY